jgi:hypothetical protein
MFESLFDQINSMVEITSPRTIYSFDIPYLLFYYALINYVVHSKLELKFASQKPPHISRPTVEIKAR